MTNIEKVPGYDRYFCSRDGRIYSNKTRSKALRELVCAVGTHGYKMAHLRAPGSDRNVLVHAIIATVFVPGRAPGLVVNHKNCDRLDNRADNLEWVTQRQNIHHTKRMGRAAIGEKSGHARITESDVRKIRAAAADGRSRKAIGREFGISPDYVGEIVRRLKWKHAL